MKYEYCCKCDAPTGRAGAGEDSLYTEHDGPFCEECFPEQAEPPSETLALPPIVEPRVKENPVFIMGSYVGNGKVESVRLGGVSFTGNGTAGREADVRLTGFFFQTDKIGSYASNNPEHQKLDLSLCDAKRVQFPVGEVYGWHGTGKGQPMCRFNVTESDMPVGSLLYTTPPQRQPEQEPDKYVMDIECTNCGTKQSGILTVNTTPPQRQPLTDEEIDEIANEFIVNYRIPAGSHYDFARAIEAAHGIKGEA